MKTGMKKYIKTIAIIVICAAAGMGICIYAFKLGNEHEYTQADADDVLEIYTENVTEIIEEQLRETAEEDVTKSTEESTNDQTETSAEESLQEADYFKVRGIYVTGPVAGSGRMEELIKLVDETDLNTMVIDVKNDEGQITWKMDSASVNEMGNGVRFIKDIDSLMTDLKEHNIYTIARIACFKDPVFAKYHDSAALKTPDGRNIIDGYGIAWVNPYDETVWEYLTEIACAAADAGFDEIQFDYVRFPIGNDAEAADYGVDTDTYTKEQAISEFLSYAYTKLHEKDIIVTADVFGTVIGSETDILRVGQNYGKLGEILDVLSPMVYPSHYADNVFGLKVPDAHPYETVYNALLLSQTVLEQSGEKNRARVRPWLQAFTASWVSGHIPYGNKQINEQIKAVYDAGYDEWMLWNASSRYSGLDIEAFKQEESEFED